MSRPPAPPKRRAPASGRQAPAQPAAQQRKASSRRAAGQSGARPKSPGRAGSSRGPSGADLLGVLVLTVTVSLAACAGGGGRISLNPQPAPAGPQGEVTVRFLDVGQGDAVLIRSPEGKTLLVDGGRSSDRLQAHLKTFGVRKIDLLVATHADADHIAGLVGTAEQRPTLFINNGLAGTTQTWERLVSALQGADTTFQKASGQLIRLGSLDVQVIAPPPGVPDDQNNHSVGLALRFGQFRALMTGDSERPETTAWLEQGRAELQGPFQLYKSIHHGASTGDHAAWLAAVRPENVVISVGDNSYGHPTPATLALYRHSGIRVYRTDQQGTVSFTARSDGSYRASTDRASADRSSP
ncbi:ComEC/Rec2 family competence protein [Deinococcus koreensis]|uniref:MBL fold metallo-hydrolase n=1 Tax=Deinococcus koreensis TaxID=2054903 RepID=A0A2K3UYC5_9DEIO|nr:ComEC/Rec2 family competence protein [Deinococcus koreensis]PNY81505.1 MBL fold metallo-hydrolase [Deinococcus koreensis]